MTSQRPSYWPLYSLTVLGSFMASLMVFHHPTQAQPSGTVYEYNQAILQGLDKLTARVHEIIVPVGTVARFGNLEIFVRSCQETPPEDPPESAAFIEIIEVRPNESPDSIFQGWMFASSPALSALEHHVYDVWVVDCRNASQ